MLRDLISPPLRELGFKGSAGKYRCTSDHWRFNVGLQKSTHNTNSLVEFTFNLSVSPILAEGRRQMNVGIRSWQLAQLTPDQHDFWWTLEPNTSVEELSNEVVNAIRNYGMPAFEAAVAVLNTPTQLPLSTNEKIETGRSQASERNPSSLFDALELIRTCSFDELLQWSFNENSFYRLTATIRLADEERHRPTAFLRLVDLLLNDDAESVRKYAAWVWAHIRDCPEIDDSLRRATCDEDVNVRWAATYALLIRKRESSAAQ